MTADRDDTPRAPPTRDGPGRESGSTAAAGRNRVGAHGPGEPDRRSREERSARDTGLAESTPADPETTSSDEP